MQIQVKNLFETVKWMAHHQASVARIGEGEIDLMMGRSIPFQEYDETLAQELKAIMRLHSTPSLMICLPDVFEALDRYNEYAKHFWQQHLLYYGTVYHENCQAPWYGSAFLSRPYIDLMDKSSCGDYFNLLKTVWHKQDLLIVEGETSRSGRGNDLFDNALSVSRIIAPSKNAYAQIDAIEAAIEKHGGGKLVLLMLGPTAKALVHRLYQKGYWAIDLGHIDSEYEWYKMGAQYKIKLDNKHTAEHNHDENIDFGYDREYDNQIVDRIIPQKEYRKEEFMTYENWQEQNELKNSEEQAMNGQEEIVYEQFEHQQQEDTYVYDNQEGVYENHDVASQNQGESNVALSEEWHYMVEESGVGHIQLAQQQDMVNHDVHEEVSQDVAPEEVYDDAVNTEGVQEQNGNAEEVLVYDANESEYDQYAVTSEIEQEEFAQKQAYESQVEGSFDAVESVAFVSESEVQHVEDSLEVGEQTDDEQAHEANEIVINEVIAHMTQLSEDSRQVLSALDNPALISVVIPIYNVGDYLDRCVQSVLDQTYTHFEVILVNDGSTDHSKAICDKFATQDERVKVIHKTNGGLSDARNAGLENVKGEFVTFIDSDDYIEPHYLERLYVEAVRHQVDITVSDYLRLDDDTAVYYFHTKDAYIRELNAFEYFDEIFKTETLAFVVAWGKLIKTELFNGAFPIRFPVGRTGEDKLVTYLLAQKAQRIVYMHEPNYCYRMRPGSITSSATSVKRAEDDVYSCEQRMLDLVLMGYPLERPLGWYQYIMEVHQGMLKSAGLDNTDIYRHIKKKLALIKKEYK